MVRITVELLPGGREEGARKLAEMRIANDGSGFESVGNYRAVLHGEYTGKDGRVGYVSGFNRQAQSVWSLVGAFLKLFGHTRHSPSKMSKAGKGLFDASG